MPAASVQSLPVWLPGTTDGPFLTALADAVPEGVQLCTSEDVPAGFAPRVLVRGVPRAAQLDAAPDLAYVVIPYAGVPEATRRLLGERPHLRLHNLHHNAAPTAELAMALMLAALKRIVPHDRDLRGGDWRRRYGEPTTSTLESKRVLVLGYGAIGRRVARACRALGMAVSAVRRGGAAASDGGGMDDGGVDCRGPEALPGLYAEADVLMLCLPLTAETRGLIGATELAQLRPGACLVNVGRGELVDEAALYEALSDGRLDSAGLDVWYRYPKDEAARSQTPPSAFPFGALDNVVLSPHRAGLTRENEAHRARDLVRLLRSMQSGEPVANAVDVTCGY